MWSVTSSLSYHCCLKGQCHDVRWFFALFFFAQAKNGNWPCKCRGHQMMTAWPREQLHRPSWVEQMSFSSSKCHFLWPCLVAAIIFPPHKMPAKITHYRDTAATPRADMSIALTTSRVFSTSRNMTMYIPTMPTLQKLEILKVCCPEKLRALHIAILEDVWTSEITRCGHCMVRFSSSHHRAAYQNQQSWTLFYSRSRFTLTNVRLQTQTGSKRLY